MGRMGSKQSIEPTDPASPWCTHFRHNRDVCSENAAEWYNNEKFGVLGHVGHSSTGHTVSEQLLLRSSADFQRHKLKKTFEANVAFSELKRSISLVHSAVT